MTGNNNGIWLPSSLSGKKLVSSSTTLQVFNFPLLFDSKSVEYMLLQYAALWLFQVDYYPIVLPAEFVMISLAECDNS